MVEEVGAPTVVAERRTGGVQSLERAFMLLETIADNDGIM
ncbi:MAG: hypothetical protein JWR35_2826, partial [Marmoricola sp.]|nr:hypothetical protein [Marmoricola sp.]